MKPETAILIIFLMVFGAAIYFANEDLKVRREQIRACCKPTIVCPETEK
jgi:hypothetical protein